MTSPGADGGWANPSGQPEHASQGWGAPPALPDAGPGYAAPDYSQPPPRGGAPYQPLDLRPGIVALRPLAVGDVLDGSLTLLRRYFRPVIAMSVLVAVVVQAVGFGLTTVTTDTDSAGVTIGLVFFSFLLSQLAGLILAGPISALAGEAVLGRPMSSREVWARTKPRAAAILLTAVFVAVLSIVGLVLFVVPFFLVLVYYAFSTQAAVLEKLPTRKAMSRSITLVRGSFWRVLGILLLAGIIARVVAVVLEIPAVIIADIATGHLFTTAAGASSLTSRAIITVGGTIAAIFTLPFTAAVHSLLYMDQRMRNEGLDVSLRQAASSPR